MLNGVVLYMKKILTSSFILLGLTSMLAFPFRTSCGDVVSVMVSPDANMTRAELVDLLQDINEVNCGTRPNIVLYTR